MGRVECLGDLARDRQDLGDRERPPCGNVSSGQAVRQCASIDELEDQAAYAVTLFDSVDGGNAGMAERRQHSGFTLEACQPVGVLGERRRQDLDCHVTGEARITCAVHLAHSARPDLGDDLVRSDMCTGR